MKRRSPYAGWKRCKKCRELVRDPDNCDVCANRDPLSASRPSHYSGQKASLTLDMQERNDGAWGDR